MVAFRIMLRSWIEYQGSSVGHGLNLVAVGLVCFVVGCSESPETVPVEHLGSSLISWTSPYSPDTVEIDLDPLWEIAEAYANSDRVLCEAPLPQRIAGVAGVPAATVSIDDQGMPVEVFDEGAPLKEGVAYVDPGRQQVGRLNAALVGAGTAACTVHLRKGPVRIAVNARGKIALSIPPEMLVRLNGETIGRFDVGAKNFHPYTAKGTARDGKNILEVEFTNDYWKPPEDRNLYLRDAQFWQDGSVSMVRQKEQGPPEGVRIRYVPFPPIIEQYARAEPAPGLKDSPGPWRYYQVRSETRPAIPLPAPGEARFDIDVRGKSSLVLGFGVVSTAESYIDETTVFQVWIEKNGERKRIDRLQLFPRDNASDRDWKTRTYELDTFGSGPASLIVTSESRTGREKAVSTRLDGHLPFLAEPVMTASPGDPSGIRNVILVSLDTLRADYLSGYGYKVPTSPILDAFAEKNIFFEAAIAQSNWTLPSHVSMLSSLYPSAHGVFRITQSLRDLETVASVLRRHGYNTGAITDGGLLSPEYGFCLGFDLYRSYNYTGFEVIEPAVEEWLRDRAWEPFFLFIHTYDTHDPYQPPKRFRDRFSLPNGVSPELVDGIPREYVPMRDTAEELAERPVSEADLQQLVNMYDGEIMYVDEQMGIIFDLLRELGHWDDTLIIVTSDHGEEFMEHGLLKHSKTLYEEIIRVPMLMRVPEGPNGVKVSRPVQILDVPPTIYDYLDIVPESEPQGRSLLSYMDDAEPVPAEAFSEDETNVSVRTDVDKLIYSIESEEEMLFDLLRDPGEQNDTADDRIRRTRQLTDRVKSFLDENLEIRSRNGATEMELSGELAEQLRNLGYMDN